jgi:predicted negative regulator of RcsB-dependent stress response
METSENAKNTNVDDLLKQTEIGSFIAKNKTAVISVIVLVLLLVVGFGFYSTYQGKVTKEVTNVAYRFTNDVFAPLQAKKLSPGKFLAQLEGVAKDVSYHDSLIPLFFKSIDEVYKQGDLASARKIIDLVSKHYLKKNSYLDYFIFVREAVIFEDQKKYNDAIVVLNKIVSLPVKVMEAKTYLDLGRLYIKVGNKQKAKSSLFYVVDNFENEEFAKLAHIYLAKLQ